MTVTKELIDLRKVVKDGKRVREFMDDETIREVLKETADKAYDSFLNAETDDQLRTAQAVRKALDALAETIAVRVQRGEAAKAELERAERAAAVEAERAAKSAPRK